IITEITLALYAILAIREPKYCPRASPLMWALSLFVLWMGLATITSVDPVRSFWGNLERMGGYINLLHIYALFVIAGAVITAQNWWERLFRISVIASIVMSLDAILQAFDFFGFGPSGQATNFELGSRAATFGNTIYLAVYLLFNIFITLFL